MEKMDYEGFAEKCLSGEIKQLFMENLIERKRLGEGVKGFHAEHQFIDCGFEWSRTPQGRNFWMGVANNLRDNPKYYAPKPKITIRQGVDKYLSGEVKERFLAAMAAESALPLETMTDDDAAHIVRSSFFWAGAKPSGKYWVDIANDLDKNPMRYAPQQGQTYRDFAKKHLSGEIYERYISNCILLNYKGFLDVVPKSIKEDSEDYLYAGFVWSETPEGHSYWSEAAKNFRANPKFHLTKTEAWVVASTYENRILDAFDTKELAEKAWGGCEEYTIKKYILAEVQ